MKNNKSILLALLSFISIIGIGQTNLNSSPFCFGNPQSIANMSFYTRAYSTDFEHDGDLDVVICDTVQHELKVFLNNGTGSFPTSLTQTITNVYDITIGQLVGSDNFTDIAVLQLDGTIKVFKNTSSSTTTASIASYTVLPPPALVPVTLVSSIDAIDYNNDYNDDLFVTYYSQVSVVTNYRYFGYTNSSGTFTLEPNIGIVPFVPSLVSADSCSVVFGNLNIDGFKDAVFSSGRTNSPSVHVQTTNYNTLFSILPTPQTITISTLAGPITDMRIEDYNNDSYLDIGIFAQGHGFSVFNGNGQPTPTFTETFIINPPSQGGKYLWKDLNNNGKNEFLSVDKVSDKISINEGDSLAAKFKSNQHIITTATSGGSSANFIIADFDGNGLNDIITSGDYNYGGEVSLIKNYSYSFKITSDHGGIVCGSAPVTLSVQTYTNLPATYAWNTATVQTSYTASINAPGSYSAIVSFTPESGATCSINSDSLNITYINGTLPIFTITPQANPFCMKVPTVPKLSFNVTGVTSYTLLANPVPIANWTSVYPGLGINTYTIDGEAVSGGCINTQTFSVVGLQAPISHPISSSNMTTTLCAGSPLTLTAHCDSTKNYLWMPGSFTNSVITVNPTSSTTYTMIASNGICTDTAMFSVNVSPVPIINASISATNICTNQGGAVVNYSGTAGNTYITSDGSNSYTASSLNLTPLVTTVYTITATNSTYSVCPTTYSIFTINVNTTPTVNVSPSTATVCANESITLTATSTANSYTWSTGSYTNTIVVTPSITSTYTVSGADVSGTCSDSKTITIYAKSLPIITASTNSTQICSGGLAVLQANGGTTYSWSPVGIFGINPSISVFPTVNTTYTVYGKGLNGCVNFTTVSVGVYSAQNINAYATPSAICVGETATLTATGGTPTVGNFQNEIVSPTINTSYSVTIKDNNGCFYNRVAYVEVNAICATIVYNGFTPNGDGVNEFFYIDHIERFTNNKVFIYNRWGNTVFETTNYNNLTNAWDGRVKGTVVPNGTYFYVINLNDGSEPKKGWLEITGQ